MPTVCEKCNDLFIKTLKKNPFSSTFNDSKTKLINSIIPKTSHMSENGNCNRKISMKIILPFSLSQVAKREQETPLEIVRVWRERGREEE